MSHTQSITRQHRTAFLIPIDGSGSMAVSIHSFTRALTAPDLWLKRLHGITLEETSMGLSTLHRTTEFVYCEVRYRGERYLLAMPLSGEAMFHAEHTLSALDRLKCPSLTPVRVRRGDLWAEFDNTEQPRTDRKP